MSYFQAFILGVIEGLTEFLPISSTGHLILINQFFNNHSDFVKSFEIIIQLGAILAVVVLYFRLLIINFSLIKKIILAFLPSLFLGYLLYPLVKNVFFDSAWLIILSLLIGGLFLIVFEGFFEERQPNSQLKSITYQQSLIIGLFQTLALIPGVSRSAATIIGGLVLGLSRRTIVEFSFLLAIPTMLGATVLEFSSNSDILAKEKIMILFFGFIVSFLTALLAVKFFLKYIQNHNFLIFGYYRIIIALIFLIFIL